MNRSILLVITDFLLLSMLALARFDDPETADTPPEPNPQEIVEAISSEEAELLEVLRLSLEAEQAERLALDATLSETRETLEEREARLEATRKTLEETSETLQAREDVLAETQETLQSREAALVDLEAQRAAIEAEAREQERLREEEQTRAASLQADLERDLESQEAREVLMQERLRAIQERLAEREAALKAEAEAREALEAEKDQIEQRRQELNTRLEVTEAQKSMLETNLEQAETQLETVQEEKERLQAQAEELTEGVTELAETSGEIRDEIQKSRPKTASTIFNQYQDNTMTVEFSATHRGMFGTTDRTYTVGTTLVSDGSRIFALLHTRDTPFALQRNPGELERVRASLLMGGQVFTVPEVGFLRSDPRVMVIPVPEIWLQVGSFDPFTLTEDPFRFDQAVLVDTERNYFGESNFKVDAENSDYLAMDARIMTRLFGEFSPSRGDMVFSKSGALMGLMVNSSRAVLLENLTRQYRLAVGGNFPARQANAVVEDMRRQIQLKGTSVR